jgi:hypothetical protein
MKVMLMPLAIAAIFFKTGIPFSIPKAAVFVPLGGIRGFSVSMQNDTAGPDREGERGRVGLCADCRFMRVVESARGSKFYLCERSVTDPTFPKYPRLPMLHCQGYEKG